MAANASAFPAFTDVPSQSSGHYPTQSARSKRASLSAANDFYPASQSNPSPRTATTITSTPDRCDRVLYAGLLLCGVGFLFPYNSFVLASDFFLRKFPQSMIVFDLSLVYILSAFVAVCVCSSYVRWPTATTRTRAGALISLCTLLLFTVFQVQYPLDQSNQSIDLELSSNKVNASKVLDEMDEMHSTFELHNLSISTAIHPHLSNRHIAHNMPHIVRLPVTGHRHNNLSQEGTGEKYDVGEYRLSLISACLLAIGCTLQQSSLYGIAAQLPPRYTHALMTGESAAGLIAAALRMVSRSASDSLQANSTLFFFTSCALVAICFLVQMRIQSTRAYAQHVLVAEAATLNQSLTNNQLINPNYGQHFGLESSDTGDEALVAKSDSTEFDLPFGIDEEELRIRLANGWNKGPAAQLGIQTLRRLSTGRKREDSHDLCDVFNLRGVDGGPVDTRRSINTAVGEPEDDEADNDENELFRLAGTIVNKRQRRSMIDKHSNSNMPNEFDLDEDELVFDIDPNVIRNSQTNRLLTPGFSEGQSNRLVSTIETDQFQKCAKLKQEKPTNRTIDGRREVTLSMHDGESTNVWIASCVRYNSWWLNRLPAAAHRFAHTAAKRLQLCNQIWSHLLSIWLAYAVTLSLFPGIESEIIDCRWRQWTAVLLIGTFNVCDLVGKLLAGFCLKAQSKHVFYAALARLLLIPLMVICAGHRQPHSFGAQMRPFAPLLSAILGLTNGLVGSLPMILAPGNVLPHHRQLTGVLMTFGYLFGLTAGSVFAYVLRALFVPPLQPEDFQKVCN
jgi:hypothetical protein